MGNVPVAGEILFKAGKLAHPFLIFQKVGEILEGLRGVAPTTLSRAQNIKVIDCFEYHKVRKSDFIATNELLAGKALNNRCEALFSTVIHLLLVRIL